MPARNSTRPAGKPSPKFGFVVIYRWRNATEFQRAGLALLESLRAARGLTPATKLKVKFEETRWRVPIAMVSSRKPIVPSRIALPVARWSDHD